MNSLKKRRIAPPGWIISKNSAGLANRIMPLVSVMRMGELLDRPVGVVWNRTPTCDCEFWELFDNEIPVFSKAWGAVRVPIMEREDEFPGAFSREFVDLDGRGSRAILIATCRAVFLKEDLSGSPALSPYLQALKPTVEIRDRLREFEEAIGFSDNLIGVHIRRTDYSTHRTVSLSTDEKFFRSMHDLLTENPKTRFLLATDCAETEDKYSEEFGDAVLYFPKRDRPTKLDPGKPWRGVNNESLYNCYRSKHAMQDALIDFLLLARTKSMLCTYGSTFAKAASQMFGAEYTVVQ